MYNRLSKRLTLASVVMICCLLKGSSARVDQTEVPNASGSDVARATIARLDYLFGTNTTFWDISHSTFMRTLAYVETLDGSVAPEDEQSQRGMWGVDIFALNNARTAVRLSSDLNNIIEEIESRLDLQWNAITAGDNLMKPFLSAIGARLILVASRSLSSNNPLCDLARFSTIDDDVRALAQVWFTCYRLGVGEIDRVSMDLFVNRANELREMSGNECNVGTDLAFVMDSSGSIGEDTWDVVKSYVRDVTATVGVEGDQRVAIVTYADFAVLNTGFTSSGDQLTSIIDNLPYLGTYTNTADGLCRLLSLTWRDNVLRFAIVMTDGESNRESPQCGDTLSAVEEIRNGITPALTVSVIGVTDNVNEVELEAIASSSSLIYHLDNLLDMQALNTIMEQQIYRICFTESATVEVGGEMMEQGFTPDDTARYSYSYQEEGVTIRLCVQNGRVVLYASLTVPNPNRALNDFALDAFLLGDICEDVFVDPSMMPDVQGTGGRRRRQTSSSPERILFVSIEGIAESSTFTLETTMGNTANYTVTCAQDVCGRNTNCTDDPVGYSCVCLPGYVFGPDLIDCQDINECERYPSPCSQFATCSNTNGSYECSCQPTHKGDGVRCILDENSDLKFILTIACSVGGGILLLVVLFAALIKIYKVMTASKHSPHHERGNKPAAANLDVVIDTKGDEILLRPENMY